MRRTATLSRRRSSRSRGSSSSLGRELRSASRRELATLKRELKDKHRARMKRARSKEASERRTKQIIAAAEVTGTAAAAGAARAVLGERLDVGPVPLELPLAVVGHVVGGYFFPDEAAGEHVHNVSNGLMAVAAYQGSQRLTEWARNRARRASSSTPSEGAVAGYGSGPALPDAESLAMLPPPVPTPVRTVYVQPPQAQPAAVAGADSLTRSNLALSQAVRLMHEAEQG